VCGLIVVLFLGLVFFGLVRVLVLGLGLGLVLILGLILTGFRSWSESYSWPGPGGRLVPGDFLEEAKA